MEPPVLVGQRIRRVRALSVKEQGELDRDPIRQGPVAIELDSGLVITSADGGGLLAVGKHDLFMVRPGNVEVSG